MNKVIETIKEYFDSKGWNYNTETESNSVIIMLLVFGQPEDRILLRIRVFMDDKAYEIAGQSDVRISPDKIVEAYNTVNDFNTRSRAVCGCITDDGGIIFWIGRVTDGDAFSLESFEREFDMIYKAADIATSQIYTQVSKNSKKRNGYFSFFSRNR